MPVQSWQRFEDRWRDRWCFDISQELADIIDESWASWSGTAIRLRIQGARLSTFPSYP